MKLYIEDGNRKIEVKEIEQVSDGEILFFMLNNAYRPEDIKQMENDLTTKINRKCIVLDARFNKVLST